MTGEVIMGCTYKLIPNRNSEFCERNFDINPVPRRTFIGVEFGVLRRISTAARGLWIARALSC